MKSLILFILTFLTLYNPKIHAKELSTTYIESISDLEIIENQVDSFPQSSDGDVLDGDANLLNFSKLVKIFKYFQAKETELALNLLEKVESQRTLSGDDLYLLKRGFDLFYKMNSQMLNFANRNEVNFNYSSKIKGRPILNKSQIKANLTWIYAHLLMINHIEKLHVILYKKDATLRRILKSILRDNQSDLMTKKRIKELSSQVESVLEVIRGEDLRNHLYLIQKVKPEIEKALKNDEISLSLLKEIFSNDLTFKILEDDYELRLSGFGFEDSLAEVFQKITNVLSSFFGNIAGSIKSRSGFLVENEEVEKSLMNSLRPMDILFEKSPFVATDKFIPGHFGHVALYFGTKEQLIELGLWSHPSIIPYQEKISEGYTILEAVRSGVRLTTIKDFMNIDEVMIMRKNDALEFPHKISEQLARGFDQIGKRYDFNFDISTLDKIVCSELIYIVFGHVNWPTKYRFDRPTVTPDDLSEILFMKNTKFSLVGYFLSTKRQTLSNPGLERLAQKFNYELRSGDGLEVKDPMDSKNSYWKKETKCYTLASREPKETNSLTTSDQENRLLRKCTTLYKEYYYEESGS